MKKKTKEKLFIGIFIGLMVCSILFLLSQNTLAIADDEDTQATLHCELTTNSLELTGSNLMTIGTHSFWEEPELDTGSSSHDATRIEVTNLQYPTYNETTSKYFNKNDGLTGNFSVNTTQISEYLLSAPFDSTIQCNISYTRNYSYFSSLLTSYDLASDGAGDLGGITTDGTYIYIISNLDDKVYKYPLDFSSLVTSYDIGALGGNDDPKGICYLSNYFYVVDYDLHVYKYPSDFSVLTTSYDLTLKFPLGFTILTGITTDGTYIYVVNDYAGEVRKFPSDFSSVLDTYPIQTYIGGTNEFRGLEWDGTNFFITDLYDDLVYKLSSSFTKISEHDVGSLGGNDDPFGICHTNNYFYVSDFDDKNVYLYTDNGSLFSNLYVSNFTYKKLGITYVENYTLVYNSEESTFDEETTSGYVIYYFDSSFFSEYDYINDITIPQQNLSLLIDLQVANVEINMTIVVSYSTCEWRVPSQVSLTINSEEIIDQTYNSGWISLDTYPTSLVITATETVYFRLNITVDFSFTFNLDVISKTYLKKTFELESDHEIDIERMDFNSNLNIKKIYLNNIDKGSTNPCYLSPAVSMDTGNEFTLEIILVDEIYLPLSYLYNNLGSGTSNIYLSAISNTLTYSNINGNQMYGLVVPNGWYVEEGYLTFSNLEYTPDYTPNYADDESGYGFGNQTFGDEDVGWGERYYQTNANGSKIGESGGSGYESVWEEYFSTLNAYMSHTYGDLDGQNSTYTVNDYLYMENLFPSNFSYEQWNEWVMSYNSSYTSSAWDDGNGELSSRLNEGTDSTVPLNTSFSMINGTHIQNGSVWSIDGDYHTFRSTVGGVSGTYPANYSFTDDADGSDPSGWSIEEGGGTVNVISSLDGHSKIVELNDNSGSGRVDIHQSLSDIEYGTIEFWYRGNEVSYHGSLWIMHGATQIAGYRIDGGYHQAYDSSSWTNIISASADTWYHISIDFECTSGSYDSRGDGGLAQYDYRIYIDSTQYGDYDFNNNEPHTDQIQISSSTGDANYIRYVDAIGYSWDAGYNIGDNLNPLPSGDIELNFTSEFQFTTSGYYSNDTIDFIRLYYSHKTNESEQINFYIWNNDLLQYDVVNISTNDVGFYNLYFTLNSSHYNGTNTIRLLWYGNASIAPVFELYIDKLLIQVNWTKTSGELYVTIDKDIALDILNRYDSYSDFQDLYNVTIEFQYRFSNYTVYPEFAQCDYYSNEYTLTKDESWHEASFNFEFDSDSVNAFNILFNISNGLLEIKDLNYTIFFKCLDLTGYNRIYQNFTYIPNLALDYLQITRGNFILNFTYNFSISDDWNYYNFTNTRDYSGLSFRIYVESESGWLSPALFQYNISLNNIAFTFNITEYLLNNSKTEFHDFYIELLITGNPSNFSLDDLILFDFDSEFYQVSALWITDTLIVSHQNITLYWKASDRYIDRVEINQEYDFNANLIFNFTLLNNTLHSCEYFNISAGFYSLNFTFYDNFSNWEKWTLNFTIMSSISISVGYENPVFINSNNTIEVHILSEYSITQIYYHNSSNNILYYDNSSYPLYESEFNFTVSFSIETIYNLSILVISEYNDTFYCNITSLHFIERTTMIDINNLHYSYYQDEMLNISILLRDLYNNPLSNKLLNYTIEDPGGIFIVNGSGTTDANGEVNYVLNFSTSYDIGFYHLNASFNGTQDYTNVWKLQSFQVRPILRSVNSTDINLKVNNHPVINNYIQINYTNNFTLSNNNTAVFDMSLYVKMNYTESISFTQYLSYSYTFSATSDILSLTFASANLTNYPSNFTDYYYNLAESTNYAISGTNFTISDLISDILYNDNSFSIMFTYLDTSQIQRVQLTDNPRTDSNIVQFREYLTANRTFSYWYFHNSNNITTVSLYHNRTAATITNSSFTVESSNYYFETSCLSGDLFTATTTYNPGWAISYEILSNNGTFTELQIAYKGSFDITNVTIALDLNDDNLYAENWSYSATQSLYTFILEIPNINFTTSTQYLTINGNSSIPRCSFAYFENEEDYDFDEDDYNDDDMEIWYRGYLSFPYYSQAFIVQGRNASWILDGIRYAGDEYDITSTGYFECPGFGSGISSAYLRFKANPVSKVERYVNYDREETEVVYRINTILEIQGAEFEFYIENDEAYTIIDIYFEGDEVDHDKYERAKLTKIDEKDYYRLLNIDLERGVNKVHIRYREEHLEHHSWVIILGLIITIAVLGFYAWKLNVLMKINKKKRLSRADFIRLLLMPWRIKDEKVIKRSKLNKQKGTLRRSWEDLKKEAAKLKKKKEREKAEKKKKK